MQLTSFFGYGTRHYMNVLDGTVGHQQSVLKLKALLVVCRALYDLVNIGKVIRVNPAEREIQRGLGLQIKAEDPVTLFGPEYFSSRGMPVKAAGVTESLCICQKSFCMLQLSEKACVLPRNRSL